MKLSPLSLLWLLAASPGVISDDGTRPKFNRRLQSVAPSAAQPEVPTTTPAEGPTATPAEEPTETPAEEPTTTPAEEPTATPADEPTSTPAEEPTATPAEEPTATPAEEPTATPAEEPTATPAEEPTATPAEEPTATPAEEPTSTPEEPTATPAEEPTAAPVAATPTVTPNDGINYYDTPRVKWTTTLTGTATMEAGNGFVRVGETIFATSGDGTLSAFDASSGTTKYSYTPNATDDTMVTRCYGEVFYATSDALGSFVVVGVSELPANGDVTLMSSFVYALDAATGDFLWQSPTVPGKIQGTPVVTQNPSRDGIYVVATHNTGIEEDSFTSTGTTGHVSVWNGDTGALVRTLTSGVQADVTGDTIGPIPYGAIGVEATPDPTANWGTSGNPTDVMMWSSAADDGTGGSGQTHGFQIPLVFSDDMSDTLTIDALLGVRWNGLAAPALTADAQNAVFCLRGGALRGWFGASFNSNADWRVDPLGGGPVRFAATYNSAETLAYIATSGTTIAAVETDSGSVAWRRDTTATLRGPILVSPEDDRVYSLAQDGKVEATDALTGELIWSVDCMDFTGSPCRNGVTGSFELSDSGIVMYYGDNLGNVRALQLGFLGAATGAPTTSGTAAPTAATEMPTVTPFPSATTGMPSMAPSLAPSEGEGTPSPTEATSAPMSFVPTPAPSAAHPTLTIVLSAAAAALASLVLIL